MISKLEAAAKLIELVKQLAVGSYFRWPCDESPIEICVYHEGEDPIHDRCLFCGNPEERK